MTTFLTKTEELIGKTIASAKIYDLDQAVCLIFTDGTVAALEVRQYSDTVDLEFTEITYPIDLYEVGLLTREQFDEIQTAEHQRRAAALKQQELEQLARLKAKYEQ